MMFSIVLAMLVAEPIDCPPVGTAARDRLKIAGEICKDEPKAPPPRKVKPFVVRPLTAAEKAEIMRKADAVLFDGPAARWQWGLRKASESYCGFVNAKNRLGAYVGWRPFYYFDGKFEVIAEDGDRIVYEAVCSGGGYIEPPQWLKDKTGR